MPLFILLLISAFVIADVAWTTVIARRLRRRGFGKVARGLFLAFMLAQFVGILWMLLGRMLAVGSPPPLLAAEMLMWHLVTLPILLIGSIVVAIVALIGFIFRRAFLHRSAPRCSEAAGPPAFGNASAATLQRSADVPTANDIATTSRRTFVLGAIAAAPPLFTLATAGYSRTQWEQFRIRKIDVALRALPRELDGLTIAQVSDIHTGEFTTPRLMTRIIEATRALNADVIAMTGDLINRRLSDLDEGLDLGRRLNDAGNVYLIEGNHDLFEGRSIFQKRVRDAGLPLLVNQSAILRPRGRAMDVQLLGLEWGTPQLGGERAARAAMPNLLSQIRDEAFPILLAHHPHAFDYADETVPLTLAGHTHGGQLGLTPSLTFGRLMYRYSSGLYRQGDRAIVVSNGVGNWFPLRVNVPAEIVQITLRKMN